MKKPKNKQGSAAERHFGVMLEHIDSQIGLLAEGQIALDQKISRVDRKVDGLKEDMDYKFDVVFEELAVIKKTGRDELAKLDKRVVALERR